MFACGGSSILYCVAILGYSVLYCVFHWGMFCIILCGLLVGVPYKTLCSISVCYIIGGCSVLYCVCHWLVFHCFLILRWRHPRRLGHLLTIGKRATVFFYSQWKTTNNAIVSFGDFTWDLHKPNGGPAPLACPAEVQKEETYTSCTSLFFCTKQV